MKSFFVSIALVLTLAACGTPIGVNSNVQGSSFQVGKTTKRDVTTKLGLPQTVKKDANNLTHWYYAKSAQTTGFYMGDPSLIAAGSASQNHAVDDKYPPGGVEFVFDTSDVLTGYVNH